MTSQQFADAALARWQELRGLPADEKMSILFDEFFRPRPPCNVEYEATLRTLSELMVS